MLAAGMLDSVDCLRARPTAHEVERMDACASVVENPPCSGV